MMQSTEIEEMERIPDMKKDNYFNYNNPEASPNVYN